MSINVSSDRKSVPNPTHHISLNSLRGSRKVGLILEEGSKFPVPTWIGGGRSTIGQSNVKYGDEGPGISEKQWINWTAGRGVVNMTDQPSGFYDSKTAWTMTPDVAMAAPMPRIIHDIRGDEFYHMPTFPSQIIHWQPLINDQKVISFGFAAPASFTTSKVHLYVRRKGTPTGSLTAYLYDYSGGFPGSLLATSSSYSSSSHDDWDARLISLGITQALTSSTVYFLVIESENGDGDSEDNCWEIGVEDAYGASSDTDVATSTSGPWTDVTWKLYTRITEADPTEILIPFVYQQALYAYTYDTTDPTTPSKLYLIGYRRKATSGSAGSLTDTSGGFSTTLDKERAVCFIYDGSAEGRADLINLSNSTALLFNSVGDPIDSTSHYIVTRTKEFKDISPSSGDLIDRRIEDVQVIYGYVVFSFGAGQPVLKMRYDNATAAHTFRDDGGGTQADMIRVYQSPSEGPKLIMVATTKDIVKIQDADGYSDDYAFGDNIIVGSEGRINELAVNQELIYAFKDDGQIYYMQADTERFTKLDVGTDGYPSQETGRNATTYNMQIYWPYGGFSVNRMLGANIDDIGPWQGAGLPSHRTGLISDLVSAGRFMFAAIDAGSGDNKYSCIMIYDGGGWHEIFRGHMKNLRVRNLAWQPVPGFGGQLVWNYGPDLMFAPFPEKTHNPENDQYYQAGPEFILTSPTIDFDKPRAWKAFKGISLVSTRTVLNIVSGAYKGGGGTSTDLQAEIYIDVQYDEDVGAGPGAAYWTNVGKVTGYPYDELILPYRPAKRMRFRLRCYNSGLMAQVRAAVVEGYTKVPDKLQWTINARVSDTQTNLLGEEDLSTREIYDILRDMSEKDLVVYMRSMDPIMDDQLVICDRPVYVPANYDHGTGQHSGRIMLNVRER